MFVDALGYIGFFFGASAYLFKSDRNLKIFQLISNLFFSFHLFGLDSLVGGISCAVGFISICFSLYDDKLKIIHFFPAFFGVLFVFSIINFDPNQWQELLPATSNLFWCYAMLYCKGQKINYFMALVIGSWMIYALKLGTYSMLLNDFIVLGFITSRIIRIYKEDKTKKISN